MPAPPPDRDFAQVLRHMLAGGVNCFVWLAILLTLGLLAYAPLGADVARAGVAAAFVAVIAGGLVYALPSKGAMPMGGPSAATALVFAALLAQIARDPQVDFATPQGLLAVFAVLAACVILMGLLQVAFGLLGLGQLARFVPQPVMAGFMNGIALLMMAGQVPKLLGLPGTTRLADVAALAQGQPLPLAIGAATAACVWWVAWKWPRAPAPLVGLLAGSALYAALAAAAPGVALGPLLGAIPQGHVAPDALLPLVGAPAQSLLLRHGEAVVLTALVLALIGGLESLFAALAADQVAQTRHDSRRELLSLGGANIASGLCGGLPLVLVRGRALSLLSGGARGRVPAIVAAVGFALIFAFGGPLIALLPSAVLAGIVVTIAVALVDRWTRQLLRQWRAGERTAEIRLSLIVVAAVCAVTVIWGFVAGVAAGLLMSMGVFIRSMNRSLLRERFNADVRPSRRIYGPAQEVVLREARRRVTVFELEGALFFGSAERLGKEAETLAADCRCLVLDFRRVSTIDESGAVLLQQLSQRLRQRGVTLLMAGVAADNAHGRRLRAFGCFREAQRDDWWPDADRATEAAERLLLAEAGVPERHSAVPLAESALLRGLDAAQVDRVRAVLVEQRLRAGERLFSEGDAGDRLYTLAQGSISVVASAKAPAAQRYVSFSPGMMFGETAMLDDSGRISDAVADTDAVVHALTRVGFERLCADDPALGTRLASNIALHLAERLRGAATAWRASAG